MKNITLDQLVALNDEMAALVRAGVPLDRGLVRLGNELPGRLGKLATEIGRRIESGESLSHIVSQTDSSFPPLYRAVVEAGLRSGRLSVGLEGLTNSVRRLADLRRMIGVSMVYPLVLVAMSYGIFILIIVNLVPLLVETQVDAGLPENRFLTSLNSLAGSVDVWWPWPPLLLGIVVFFTWFRSGRSIAHHGMSNLFSHLPTLSRISHCGRMAAFAEVLAILVEYEVPLDEAVRLAAEASGDQSLKQSGSILAEQIGRGERLRTSQLREAGFSPLLSWLIASGTRQDVLVQALRNMAEHYRSRAMRLSYWLFTYLPIILAVAIGAPTVVFVATTVLGPWYKMLFDLSHYH